MKEESKEMASRLRENQKRNLGNYEMQAQKAERRIDALEKLAQENFVLAGELRRKHLKAQ